MARGLESPNLDDRTWQDIVDRARSLIPKYAPEWTDHNPSDLGIALIELFAWIVESVTYRLNRVPEKNFIEFLNLLNIHPDSATPASTFLTYSLASGSSSLTVDKGSQAATPQTETEEAIVFETDRDLRVLPINLTSALCFDQDDENKFSSYKNVTANLVGSPLSGLSREPLKIPANKSKMIALGFDSASPEEIALLWRFSQPVQESEISITWNYSSDARTPENPSNEDEFWDLIAIIDDGTEGLQKNGEVSLVARNHPLEEPPEEPRPWTAQNPQDWVGISASPSTVPVEESLFWIGIHLVNPGSEPVKVGLEHILFNSVSATNALSVTESELLGVSNGEPFQFFELRNRPLFKQPGVEDPYEHLIIQVREPQVGGGFEETDWIRQDDFPKGAGNYFRLDPTTGVINFGNYHPTTSPDGHGNIPPTGSELRAGTKLQTGSESQVAGYRYVVGGRSGNVPSNKINVPRTPINNVIGVTNLGFATGGSDEEAIEETKRRAPELLRNRYRAITPEDYEYLAREASTHVKKVRCLSPRLFTTSDEIPGDGDASVGDPWTYGGLDRSPGAVNVIIISPALPDNPTPMPPQDLLQEVSDYLDARRPLTNRLSVTFPRYLPINVEATIKIFPSAERNGLVTSKEKVLDETRAKIDRFLHPLLGGVERNGWEVGQEIPIASLLEAIQLSDRIGYIADLKIAAGTPLYQPSTRPYQDTTPGIWLPVADYEIICSGTHTVEELEEL